MNNSNPFAVWKESDQGMSVMDVTFQAAQPEFDGALIHVPVATREEDSVELVLKFPFFKRFFSLLVLPRRGIPGQNQHHLAIQSYPYPDLHRPS